MSEEVAISEVSSNGASLSSQPQPAQRRISLPEEAQGPTEAPSANSASDSSLLPTDPSVAPPVDDIPWDLGHYETGVVSGCCLMLDLSINHQGIFNMPLPLGGEYYVRTVLFVVCPFICLYSFPD